VGYDKRRDGGQGRALRGPVRALGLLENDRLEPSPLLSNVAKFEGLTPPFEVMFWRSANETIAKHRNPLFSVPGVTISSFAIDALHTLHLGVWKTIVVLRCGLASMQMCGTQGLLLLRLRKNWVFNGFDMTFSHGMHSRRGRGQRRPFTSWGILRFQCWAVSNLLPWRQRRLRLEHFWNFAETWSLSLRLAWGPEGRHWLLWVLLLCGRGRSCKPNLVVCLQPHPKS
jgi:hypothetical protein